jgi:hypothetical protein
MPPTSSMTSRDSLVRCNVTSAHDLWLRLDPLASVYASYPQSHAGFSAASSSFDAVRPATVCVNGLNGWNSNR